MGYKKDVIKGVSFVGFLRFATKVVGFLEVIILAKILLPAQFGAYGVALLALGVLEVMTETGVNIFLLQEKLIDEFINSAWVVSIIRGIFISVILFAASPSVAAFFHSEQSLILLRLIALVPVLRGFINPAVVKFQKNLLFFKDLLYRFTILLIDTTVSITVTYLTRSPIGIVLGLLSGVAVELLLSFLVISPRPSFYFKRYQIMQIFHRGKWVTAAGLFDYLYENFDTIVVGRMLGAGALGVYQLAYAIAVVPLNEIGKVFVHVVTPVMIRFSDDSGRLQNSFLKTIGSVVILSVPWVCVLFFFPHLFVLLLGSKWAQISSIFPILAIVGIVRSLSGTSSAVFLSKKKQNFITVTTLITILGLSISIIPLVNRFGIVGAALAGLIGSLSAVPVVIYFVIKIL